MSPQSWPPYRSTFTLPGLSMLTASQFCFPSWSSQFSSPALSCSSTDSLVWLLLTFMQSQSSAKCLVILTLILEQSSLPLSSWLPLSSPEFSLTSLFQSEHTLLQDVYCRWNHMGGELLEHRRRFRLFCQGNSCLTSLL